MLENGGMKKQEAMWTLLETQEQEHETQHGAQLEVKAKMKEIIKLENCQWSALWSFIIYHCHEGEKQFLIKDALLK